ncbi:tyrosine-protein phosphatase [Cellulomonas soli]|uniref:Tyrosine specific protein phosphatases domain-containing protein n=1 Tax=Cellulomonas soli TaxID=931535 RepID=A0A512PA24_9CELL|nr:tyrosine-protein phosphatase [Cellulomonas soli]NYI60538.1 protein-tyrosine phosphatase [Cellulomonas soli]GEP68053.1 hypothetical protein CSO01_07680 [Cellulomonas soli]
MGIAEGGDARVVRAGEERVLRAGSFVNLRDVGGYRAGRAEGAGRAGRVTRWRRLLRADLPAGAGRREAEGILALGVRRVVDLRDAAERAEVPSPFRAAGLDVVDVPLFGGSAESLVAAGVSLPGLYAHLLGERGESLAEAVRVVASGSSPVLVHCTAGKDRTGLTVALALAAVGVDRATVVADYAVTQDLLAGAWLERRVAELEAHHGAGLGDRVELLGGSPPRVLEEALVEVERRWGSVHGYLVAHGLDPAELAALRAFLTVGADAADPVEVPAVERAADRAAGGVGPRDERGLATVGRAG